MGRLESQRQELERSVRRYLLRNETVKRDIYYAEKKIEDSRRRIKRRFEHKQKNERRRKGSRSLDQLDDDDIVTKKQLLMNQLEMHVNAIGEATARNQNIKDQINVLRRENVTLRTAARQGDRRFSKLHRKLRKMEEERKFSLAKLAALRADVMELKRREQTNEDAYALHMQDQRALQTRLRRQMAEEASRSHRSAALGAKQAAKNSEFQALSNAKDLAKKRSGLVSQTWKLAKTRVGLLKAQKQARW